MTDTNRIVWSEGLFLRPQHFQQQQRHLERYLEGRAGAPHRHLWGLLELDIDRELLAQGKLVLRRARGVFPDGTPISMPDDDPVPPPLELTTDTRDRIAYIALPVRRSGALEIERNVARQTLVRYELREFQARDVTRESSDAVPLEVGAVRAQLLLEGAPVGDFAMIPFARVVECRANRQVVLDENFMPTALDLEACAPLKRFAQEIVGMVNQRAEELSRIVGGTQHGSVSDLGEFLRLQTFNRHEPLLRHLGRQRPVHPEELYRALLALAGDLATLAGGARRTPSLPDYEHARLQPSFEPLMKVLRTYLDARIALHVVPIAVELKQKNVYLARVNDVNLFDNAMFVIAAKAQVPPENLRRLFPTMTTLIAAPALKRYVDSLLPGIGIRPLGSLPPSIPFHAGYEYFELDRTHESWRDLKSAGAFGLFVGDGLPGLEMQMWALRQ